MRIPAFALLLMLAACGQAVAPGQRAQDCTDALAAGAGVTPPQYVRLTPAQWPERYGSFDSWYELDEATVYHRGERLTSPQAAHAAAQHVLAQTGGAPDSAFIARAERRCGGNGPAATRLYATAGFDRLVAVDEIDAYDPRQRLGTAAGPAAE